MKKKRLLSQSFANAAMSFDAARVVAARTPMILASATGAAPQHRDEMRRMFQEKSEAGVKGALGAGAAAGSFWVDLAFGRIRSAADVSQAMRGIAEAATAPARRTVRANAKRLGKAKKS